MSFHRYRVWKSLFLCNSHAIVPRRSTGTCLTSSEAAHRSCGVRISHSVHCYLGRSICTAYCILPFSFLTKVRFPRRTFRAGWPQSHRSQTRESRTTWLSWSIRDTTPHHDQPAEDHPCIACRPSYAVSAYGTELVLIQVRGDLTKGCPHKVHDVGR